MSYKKILITSFLITCILIPIQMGSSLQTNSDTPYYFYSSSQNPLQANNQIQITVSEQGDALVRTRLNTRASYPLGIGEYINLSIPYPESEISILEVTAFNQPAEYTTSSTWNETIIHLSLDPSIFSVPIQLIYTVRNVYDQDTFNFKFKQSATTTELAINILIDTKTNWIDRRSLEFSPESSKDTFFLISQQAMPFDLAVALSNIAPRVISISIKTQWSPISLEYMPFYALPISIFPWLIIALIRIIGYIFNSRKVGAAKIAYRNMIRRPVRFLLTLLGILIPSSLLVILLIQVKVAQQLLGTSNSNIEWSLILVLAVAFIIGGFQVVNAVFSSVLERIRELGVMRAVGFKPSFIVNTVIAESVFLGIIAGFLGAVIGVGYVILSYNPFYGASLAGDAVARVMVGTYGEVSIFNPMSFIENPWYRNYLLASFAMMGICFKSFTMTDSSEGLISSTALFFLLLRPVDPFLITLLLDLSSMLFENITIATLFAVGISTLAGLYVSRRINKITTIEAMRHV